MIGFLSEVISRALLHALARARVRALGYTAPQEHALRRHDRLEKKDVIEG